MKHATLMKNWTLLQVFFERIFWLVFAQLQNGFFVEHLPVASYVHFIKEKGWKKWNSVFLLYSVWHSSLWHWKVQSGKAEQIKNISASKNEKKVRTASLKLNLLVLIKKKSVLDFGVSAAIMLSSNYFPYLVQVWLWNLARKRWTVR